jgi:hypothetical protein
LLAYIELLKALAMAKRWKREELDELARRHIEYEVRKLLEYVRELETDWGSVGHVAAGQALIEASLIHLRNLHEFLRPSGTRIKRTPRFTPSPGHGKGSWLVRSSDA